MCTYRKIVVIEDDPESCSLFEAAIPEVSKEVSLKCYSNVIDFMNDVTATQQVPDLIFIEINLRKINGFIAAELFKAHALLQNIPFIILTNSRADEDINRLFNLGATRYIVKPTKYSDLVNVLRNVGLDSNKKMSIPTSNTFLLSYV